MSKIFNNNKVNSEKEQAVDVLIQKINEFSKSSNKKYLLNFVSNLHNADIADIIQNLEDNRRLDFINDIKNVFDPEILTYLNESLKDEIINNLDIKKLASNASELDVDDAVDVVEDLVEADQAVFLSNISVNERKLIEEGLKYPEDSAGRLMQRKFVAINDNWNVGNTIDYLRKKTDNLPDDFYDIFLIDENNIVTGIVPLGRLMSSSIHTKLNKIQNKETRIIEVSTDQEEVAYQFNK